MDVNNVMKGTCPPKALPTHNLRKQSLKESKEVALIHVCDKNTSVFSFFHITRS